MSKKKGPADATPNRDPKPASETPPRSEYLEIELAALEAMLQMKEREPSPSKRPPKQDQSED